MSDDRTERASPRKRQRAAEKGDHVRSRELVSAAAMLAAVGTLGFLAERWAGQWFSAYQVFLALARPKGSEDVAERALSLRHGLIAPLLPLLLLFAAATAGALLAGIAQGGGLSFHAEALALRWQRVDPVQNAKNLVSMRGLGRLLKSLLPASLLAVLAVRRILVQTALPPLSMEELPGMLHAAYSILLDTAWILLGWSAVDYLIEWRSWEQRQRMSKQELREEYRQSEGSPQIRARIRSLRRQMRRLLKPDISRATVVITNPIHYAVALSFSFETMEPPKMVAKGRDLVAAQIKEEARWAGVPIIENPPLARALYRHLEPGQTIPYNLYSAVAAILAYLYRQQVEERLRREQSGATASNAGRGAEDKSQRPSRGAPSTPAATSTQPMNSLSAQERL